jgi:hypothetical protein
MVVYSHNVAGARGEKIETVSPAVLTAGVRPSDPLKGAYLWLSMFYLVYCARPEDWVPGLHFIPIAKISAIFAVLALLTSLGNSKRSLRHLPREGLYLLALICILFVSALLSPVWKGGAFFRTIDFAKVFVVWVLTVLVLTDMQRFKRIAYIQTASVAAVALISIAKGHSRPRLEGVLGGIYSNPNDLAFAIVLSIPFCLAFFIATRKLLSKAAWLFSMLIMCACLFLTASRAGFITLLISGAACLWHFAVKGRRIYLVAGAGLVFLLIGVSVGGKLKERFLAMSGRDIDSKMEVSAYGSYEQRRELMIESLRCMARYPLLGIGVRNFTSYTPAWREVHVAYLQIGAEGGIVSLILYILFFARGFGNLRRIGKIKDVDPEIKLFSAALHSSLLGFLVGALFAPEAYQYFPYFAVAYTTALLLLAEEQNASKMALRDPKLQGGLFAHQVTSRSPEVRRSPEFAGRI